MNREKMPRIHQETADQKPARSAVKRQKTKTYIVLMKSDEENCFLNILCIFTI